MFSPTFATYFQTNDSREKDISKNIFVREVLIIFSSRSNIIYLCLKYINHFWVWIYFVSISFVYFQRRRPIFCICKINKQYQMLQIFNIQLASALTLTLSLFRQRWIILHSILEENSSTSKIAVKTYFIIINKVCNLTRIQPPFNAHSTYSRNLNVQSNISAAVRRFLFISEYRGRVTLRLRAHSVRVANI